MRSVLKRLIRHFPPVARRDRRIARQAKQIQRLEDANRSLQETVEASREKAQRAEFPNFGVMLIEHRRYIGRADAAEAHDTSPVLQIPFKLRNIAFAQSHGVPTTQIYRIWETIDEIDLAGLPDEFVLKADGGAGGHAVFPLRRTLGGYERIGSKEVVTPEQLRQRLTKLGRRARPPYFAEELLRTTASGGAVPDDVKIYTFYGSPAQVLLMRIGDPTRRHATTTRKYIDPITGTSLGQVLMGRRIDETITAPRHLDQMVEAASHLSRATGLSFCRVDFYDTPNGPVFGEITRAPGGHQRYAFDHDAGMGEAWLDARVRLETDLANGRPHGMIWGEHPYRWQYENYRQVSAWGRTTLPCEQWCTLPG